MSKFDNKKIIPRYSFIAVMMTVLGIAVVGKAAYTMSVKHDYWMEVSKQKKKDNVPSKPTRGNILSDNQELMASTLPEYRLIMDFVVGGEKKDKLWQEKVDSICEGLHEIFPEKSAKEFKEYLETGRKKKSQYWPIWPKLVNYETFIRVSKLPIFNMPRYQGGFRAIENNARKKPFGSLASRTIGDMDHTTDSARYGLEATYDSILRGQTGFYHQRKVLDQFLDFPDEPATNGDDIVTTINVQMQDIAEKALEEKLIEINGDVGVAIVMEVATGDVKAIVNLEKSSDGVYRERLNHAVADILEPGSVFKTASVMVALDDGVVDTTYQINTGNGIKKMWDCYMKDHNHSRGGYGTISLGRSMQVSSNIGISYTINQFYGKEPEKFVDGLYRIGIGEDLKIPIKEYVPPRIRRPERTDKGKLKNWPLTTLPWMSIGYATQIAPINTLTFYNAIANNGKMMRPRFVKQRVREGEVVMEYPPVVLREQICKPQTLSKVRAMLEQVVYAGTGGKAKCESFRVAGKTGTAQISKGRSGYKSGVTRYLASFAGYFPAEKPRYSCIVCVQKTGLPASGGEISGWVFHNIAEGIMAHNLNMSATSAVDDKLQVAPLLLRGNLTATNDVLKHLGYETVFKSDSKKSLWGAVGYSSGQYLLNPTDSNTGDTMPDVTGLGARDAVFMLEQMGLKVNIQGRGKVKRQSIASGKKIRKGELCELTLSI